MYIPPVVFLRNFYISSAFFFRKLAASKRRFRSEVIVAPRDFPTEEGRDNCITFVICSTCGFGDGHLFGCIIFAEQADPWAMPAATILSVA